MSKNARQKDVALFVKALRDSIAPVLIVYQQILLDTDYCQGLLEFAQVIDELHDEKDNEIALNDRLQGH